ncbi:MAG TPA: enoyl-CoA hydratase-related protein [Acidimicrobiia bacterium]|nr:enoyl-CoA hydratase-related protein [Acidimicrobiia bacterium]
MAEFITTERHDNGVELIRFSRPPMNALSAEFLGELADHARALAGDADLKAVVVTGSEKVFAAGAEISQLRENDFPLIDNFRRAFDGLAAIPRPVIAAVSGFALGGGLEAALACDLRLASENARLGVPEIQLGVFPGAGGTQRLARLVGPAKAKELIWTGRHVRADEALAMGLVDRVVPVEGYLDAALEWAGSFAAGAVVAMGLSKKAVDGGLDGSLTQGLDLEKTLFRQVLDTEDAAAGIKSFFENGPGKAKFAGR